MTARSVALIVALAVTTGTVAITAVSSPAGAASAQTCNVAPPMPTFTPGIDNTATNQTLKFVAQLGTCTPRSPSGGSGRMTMTATATKVTCGEAIAGHLKFAGTARIAWSNGKVSVLAATFGIERPQSLLTITANIAGTVTSGPFRGGKLTSQSRYTPNGNCTTTKVTRLGSGRDSTPVVIT